MKAKAVTIEQYKLETDLKVLGFEVKDFPEGIGEAFDKLVNLLPGGFDRPYYGLSQMSKKDGKFIYLATALEKFPGEAEKYKCERYTIEKGEYLTVPIKDWRKKTDTIKDVFHELFKDPRVDMGKPCVEWYKNEEEMLCMVKMDFPKI